MAFLDYYKLQCDGQNCGATTPLFDRDRDRLIKEAVEDHRWRTKLTRGGCLVFCVNCGPKFLPTAAEIARMKQPQRDPEDQEDLDNDQRYQTYLELKAEFEPGTQQNHYGGLLLSDNPEVSKSSIFCDHANEMPGECVCYSNCYCKYNSCSSQDRLARHPPARKTSHKKGRKR